MLEELKALIAVEKLGTVSEAAVQLRLTQSAVSKRIQNLESELGQTLVEKDGRRLRLTLIALELLSKAKPLLAEFESLKFIKKPAQVYEFSIGIADSIASSWGPAVLRRTMKTLPNLKLAVHVHRSTLIVENIRLGRYDLGLVTGQDSVSGLVSLPVTKEEMVLLGNQKQNRNQQILTIETASATWKAIGAELSNHKQIQGRQFEFVESFSAAAQMAREGFGQALVPLGIVKALGFKKTEYVSLSPKIERQIQLITRKSVYELDMVQKFNGALSKMANL